MSYNRICIYVSVSSLHTVKVQRDPYLRLTIYIYFIYMYIYVCVPHISYIKSVEFLYDFE